MIDVVGLFNSVMALLGSLEEIEHNIAEQYEYSEVEADLNKLRAEVKRAQLLDAADNVRFWNNLEQLVGPTVLREQRLAAERVGQALRNASEHISETVAQRCRTDFGRHADVPAKLQEQTENWRSNQRGVAEALKDVAPLVQTQGWHGASAVLYAGRAFDEAAALKELEGLMKSAGQACRTGAVLNRAVFYVVAKHLRRATRAINGAGNWGPAHRRTQVALREMGTLLHELGAASSGSVAQGSANTLAVEMRRTVAMPNYLGNGRRSRPGATGPARTDRGVTSDGRDVNLGG